MAVTKADVLAIINSKLGGFVLEIHPNNLWQDTTQTNAVTATGQAVQYIEDQSIHGFDFSRTGAVGASSPLLQQDANGNYYLENANSGSSPTALASVIQGVANTGTVYGNKPYAVLSALADMQNANEFYFGSSVDSSATLNNNAIHIGSRNADQLTIAHWFNDANFSQSAGALTPLQVHTAKFLNPGSKYFLDGVEVGNNATTPAALGVDFIRYTIYNRTPVDGSTSNAGYFYGKIYAMVGVLGDTLTAQEQADIEEWIGIQAGLISPSTTYNVSASVSARANSTAQAPIQAAASSTVTARATSTAQAFAQTPVSAAATAKATGSSQLSIKLLASAASTARATSTAQAFAQTPVSSTGTARATSAAQVFSKSAATAAISARSTQTSTLANKASATATATAAASSTGEFTISGGAQIEELWADAHLAGAATNPENATGVTDGVFTTDVGPANWTSRWSMSNPVNNPTGQQTIKVIARTDNPTGTAPTIDSVNLYENGVLVQQVIGSTSITAGTTGQELVGTFDASAIVNGDLVEIEIVTTGAGGPPANRSAVQIDSINWEANTIGSVTYQVTASVTAKAVSSAQADALTPVSASIAARATSSAQALAKAPVSSAITARATSTGQAFVRSPVSFAVTAKATSTAAASIQAATSAAVTARATQVSNCVIASETSAAVIAKATSTANFVKRSQAQGATIARAETVSAFVRNSFATASAKGVSVSSANATVIRDVIVPVSGAVTARATSTSASTVFRLVQVSAAATGAAAGASSAIRKAAATSTVTAKATPSITTSIRIGLKSSASAISNSQAILSFVAFMAPSEATARALASGYFRGQLPNNEAPSRRQVFVSGTDRTITLPSAAREIRLYSVK